MAVWLRVAKWALTRKEVKDLKLDDVLSNWEACMSCGKRKGRRFIGFPPPKGSFKFNVDETTKGKPGPFKYWRCPFIRGKMFSKNVGVKRFERGSNFGHSRIL